MQAAMYLNSTDIIGSDPYVIPKSQVSGVGQATKTINNIINESRPVWMVIQAHNIGNYKFIPDPQNYRSPTFDEMRSMSWQSICNGANGLIYYSYFDLKSNPDVSFDIQWNNLKRIADEIDKVSPVLLSTNTNDNIKVEGTNGVNTWFNRMAKEYNNKIYVFVVNNGSTDGEIKVSFPVSIRTINLWDNNSLNLKNDNSQFIDTLKSFDLKIYVLE